MAGKNYCCQNCCPFVDWRLEVNGRGLTFDNTFCLKYSNTVEMFSRIHYNGIGIYEAKHRKMLNEELLKRVIIEQQGFLEPGAELWEREYQDNIRSCMDNDHIILLTGVRRAGKSFLLKITGNIALSSQFCPKQNLLYINFEDERLADIETQELSRIIEIYYRLLKPDFDKKIVLLFDEIQHAPNWDRWINRLYEQKKFKIFITGSNASLLKQETGKLLTGRHISIDIFPLSFKEYLYYFKKETLLEEKDFYDLKHRARLMNAFEEYCARGGFPDYLKTGDYVILQEYFKDIIQRDIIYRHNIRYKKEMKEIAKIIISGPGNILSLKKITAAVGLKNISTTANYINYLQSSYLVFGIPIFSPSVKKQVYNPDKYYGIDAGMYQAVSFRILDNMGPLLENIVFLELKRRLKKLEELFYYKTRTGREIDFLVWEPGKIRLIQVSYDMSDPTTFNREKNAIIEAAAEIGIKEGIIVTASQKDEIIEEGTRISIIPAAEFLLF